MTSKMKDHHNTHFDDTDLVLVTMREFNTTTITTNSNSCRLRCQKRKSMKTRRRLLSLTSSEVTSETLSSSVRPLNPRMMLRSFSSPADINFPEETVPETVSMINSQFRAEFFAPSLQLRLSPMSSNESNLPSSSASTQISYRTKNMPKLPNISSPRQCDLVNEGDEVKDGNFKQPLRLQTENIFTVNQRSKKNGPVTSSESHRGK